jgi:hypothetical protein
VHRAFELGLVPRSTASASPRSSGASSLGCLLAPEWGGATCSRRSLVVAPDLGMRSFRR